MQVIRTRMREKPENGVRKYIGLYQTSKLIYTQEGFIGLYSGMTAHLLRGIVIRLILVVPNAAILFLSYEVILSFIK